MEYTIKEWLAASPLRQRKHFKQWNFFYAIALEDIAMGEGAGRWSDKPSYLCRCARTKKTFWIYQCNVRESVKKNEFFICGQTDHLFGVERATGVMTFERVKNKFKLSDGTDSRIARYLTRKQFKRERNVYAWYEGERKELQDKYDKSVRDMNENISNLQFPENKDVEYLVNVKNKRIKTYYGIENGRYNENFTILTSPYDCAPQRICKDEKELKKWGFLNHDEVMSFVPKFPVYVIKGELCDYVCEKDDFKLLRDNNHKFEIEYVNKWEDECIRIEGELKKRKRWLDRCLSKIKNDVYKNYPEYMDRWKINRKKVNKNSNTK